MDRPITTLFMIMSVDGKISTGSTDALDIDKDFPKIKGVKEGLKQYYDIEKTTDYYSLNSGKVMAKIGVNSETCPFNNIDVNFIIIDNSHLTAKGIQNLVDNITTLFLVTKNKNHPAFKFHKISNLKIIFYSDEIDFVNLFKKLKAEFGIEQMTIQSGSSLNTNFLRKKLIDKISIVVAPCLIGGKDTPTLLGGESLLSTNELHHIKALKLIDVKTLDESYIHLKYKVLNNID